jgi:hypothetical protein
MMMYVLRMRLFTSVGEVVTAASNAPFTADPYDGGEDDPELDAAEPPVDRVATDP